jgi:ABC-type phosphate/phosphonate transport system substrate-binding protein
VSRTFFAILLAPILAPALSLAGDKDAYRIGIPRSVFREVPPALVNFAGSPFKDIMKAQTGLTGEVSIEPDAMAVARSIDARKSQLGVFFGHEFAWAKQKYPKLEPIVCSVPRPKEVQAVLLVRWDCKAANLGDLKGSKLAMATMLRDHARLFLKKSRNDEMGDSSFCSTEKADTVHAAIHKVIDGEADLTVADFAAWNYFQKLYPGLSQNLRVLSRSDLFPPTVIAYEKGTLDEATVKTIREGLMTAHQNSKAMRMMNMIRVERFDAVPDNYDEDLKRCLEAYPAPTSEK